MNFEKEVSEVLEGIKIMLIEKNSKYGNSALDPQRVFSKADSIEQIKVRIDDKLSRIKMSGFDCGDGDSDSTKDLLGYLVLLLISAKYPK